MRGLKPVLEGRRILGVEQRRKDLRFPFPKDFSKRLAGRRVLSLTRRAKYILAAIEGVTGVRLTECEGVSESAVLDSMNEVSLAKRAASTELLETGFGEARRINREKGTAAARGGNKAGEKGTPAASGGKKAGGDGVGKKKVKKV